MTAGVDVGGANNGIGGTGVTNVVQTAGNGYTCIEHGDVASRTVAAGFDDDTFTSANVVCVARDGHGSDGLKVARGEVSIDIYSRTGNVYR